MCESEIIYGQLGVIILTHYTHKTSILRKNLELTSLKCFFYSRAYLLLIFRHRTQFMTKFSTILFQLYYLRRPRLLVETRK